MAERTTSDQRQRRSEARKGRRAMTAEPFERLDEAARDGGGGRSALKEAMATATAGAIAAGIAGAAKAIHDRRSSEPGENEEAPAHEEEEPAVEPEPERTEPRADAAADEPAEAEAADEGPAQPETGGEEGDEPRSEEDGGEEQEDAGEEQRPRGASSEDAKGIVDEARRQLEEVLSVEPESVSGVRRSDHGWTVAVEVVEVQRIPDSTDVLASYEVTLDDDRNLVGVEQRRRYLRSQVEGGR